MSFPDPVDRFLFEMWKLYAFALLLFVATGFMIHSTLEQRRYAVIEEEGEPVNATVVEHGTRGLSTTGYEISYEYVHRGETYRETRLVDWTFFNEHQDGAKIAVKVDPRDPSRSIIPGNKAERSLISFGGEDPFYLQVPWPVHGLLALLFFAGGAALVVLGIKKHLRGRRAGDEEPAEPPTPKT